MAFVVEEPREFGSDPAAPHDHDVHNRPCNTLSGPQAKTISAATDRCRHHAAR
jgi:hypothetical protein